MKRLLFAIFLVSPATWGALSFVAATSEEAFTTNVVNLPAVNSAAGNGIACIASWDGFVGSITWSNTAGDTWNHVDTWNDSNSFQRFDTAYVKSSAGNAADVITATQSGADTQIAASCVYFSGQDPTAPLDTHVTGEADNATTVTSGSFTTATANQFIFAGLGAYNSGKTWTAGNIGGAGATIPSGAISPFKFIASEYLIVSSIQSSITADASINTSSSALGIGVMTFKEASAATFHGPNGGVFVTGP